MHNFSGLSALRQRAAAEGITDKQLEEVYEVCHDQASFELWDASEEAQEYMAELWTINVLCRLSTAYRVPLGCFADVFSVCEDTEYKAFDSAIHDLKCWTRPKLLRRSYPRRTKLL